MNPTAYLLVHVNEIKVDLKIPYYIEIKSSEQSEAYLPSYKG